MHDKYVDTCKGQSCNWLGVGGGSNVHFFKDRIHDLIFKAEYADEAHNVLNGFLIQKTTFIK